MLLFFELLYLQMTLTHSTLEQKKIPLCLDRIFFMHSSTDGHLGLGDYSAIGNGAARQMDTQVSLCDVDSESFEKVPRSQTTGPHDSSIFTAFITEGTPAASRESSRL